MSLQSASLPAGNSDPTAFDLLALLIRRWRILGWSCIAGGFIAGAASLLSPRQFVSTATFVPEASRSSAAGLAAAARQFGIGVSDPSGSAWTPGLYVQVLTSDALMVSLAGDSVALGTQMGSRTALVDLFEVPEGPPLWRQEKLVRILRREVVSVSEARQVGSVTIKVSTRWAKVSAQVAEALVRRVDELNKLARREQAAAELAFLDERFVEAQEELSAAEERLLQFLERNRVNSDPSLVLRREVLERKVRLQEEVALTLAQQREDARLRRFRDTPSVTLVEAPREAEVGRPRGTILRAVLGAAAGFLGSLALLLLLHSLESAASRDSEGALAVLAASRQYLPSWIVRLLDRYRPAG